MNYKKHYENLIISRKKLNRKKNDGIYYESHHVIPKSCGGSNEQDNLVLLTFKEHFIAHILLTKIYDGELKRKMYYALWRMSKGSKNHKRAISATQYQLCREAEQKAKIGHIVSDETKLKISKGNTGKVRTEEVKSRIRKKLIGTTHETSQETKNKISKGNTGKVRTKEVNYENSKRNLGKKQSEETKAKRSKKLLGKSRPKEVVERIIKNNPLRQIILCSNGKTYDSIGIASRELNLSQSNISAVCNGRRKSTGGYKFKKINLVI